MLLLEFHNKIIEDTLIEKWGQEDKSKFESIEMVLSDFDGVTYHVSSDSASKNLLNISISIKCWDELVSCGVDAILDQHYSQFKSSPETGYNFSMQLDLASPPSDYKAVAHTVALLKRHCFAAPFNQVMEALEKKETVDLTQINYRDDEAFYVKTEGSDRVQVIFQVSFKDADDVVFAKVFLQEYADANKTLRNVPAVTYSREPPSELQSIPDLRVGETSSFITFVLFQPHCAKGAKREKTIDTIETFRNYLHYHIKCSKAYIHTRMRNRVRTFLQVLNRAKSAPAEAKEKKTITGKSFRRADDAASTLSADMNI